MLAGTALFLNFVKQHTLTRAAVHLHYSDHTGGIGPYCQAELGNAV